MSSTITFWCNINDGYATSANELSGTSANPLDRSLFKERLNNGLYGLVNQAERNFKIKGGWNISEDLFISDSYQNYVDGGVVRLTSWEDGVPWYIKHSNQLNDPELFSIINGYDSNEIYPSSKIVLINGRIDTTRINFKVWNDEIFTNTRQLLMYNMWVRSIGASSYPSEFKFYGFNDVKIINSTTTQNNINHSNDSTRNFRLCCDTSIINSIVDTAGFESDVDINLSASNVQFVDESYTKSDSIVVYEDAVYYGFSCAELSATYLSSVGASEIGYLTSGFSAIGPSGSNLYTTDPYEIETSGCNRDGIGAIYFNPIVGLITSSPLSGYAGLTSFSISADDTYLPNSMARSISIDLDNDAISAGNTATVTYTYSAIFRPTVTYVSKNGWYLSTASHNISAYDQGMSVGLELRNVDGTSITSAYNTDDVYYYPILISGTPTSAVFNYGDSVGTLSLPRGTTSITSASKTYITGVWDASILITNELGQSASASVLNFSAFQAPGILNFSSDDVSEYEVSEYWVDLDSEYANNVNNIGTSADPFNINEFIDRINLYGDVGDIYNVKGVGIISSLQSISENYVIDAQQDKNFIIRAWDVSAYGPWILVIEANNSDSNLNPAMSFNGCAIIHGIIYDSPFDQAGCKIKLSTAIGCWIVSNGSAEVIFDGGFDGTYVDASGTWVSTKNSSFMIGSNLYAPNFEYPVDQYQPLNVIDSVFHVKDRTDVSATSGVCIIGVNSVFNMSMSAMNSYYGVISGNNQFSFQPPSNYPFSINNHLFKKSITYVINNRADLAPFVGISVPPQPGINSPVYPKYETDFFGYNRSDYQRT